MTMASPENEQSENIEVLVPVDFPREFRFFREFYIGAYFFTMFFLGFVLVAWVPIVYLFGELASSGREYGVR